MGYKKEQASDTRLQYLFRTSRKHEGNEKMVIWRRLRGGMSRDKPSSILMFDARTPIKQLKSIMRVNICLARLLYLPSDTEVKYCMTSVFPLPNQITCYFFHPYNPFNSPSPYRITSAAL